MAVSTDRMNQLIKKRGELEEEIKALNDVLDSQKSVGMDGPLVDTEGFPRSDIDIYSVRHARHQLICLQNDYKTLMEEIEEELYNIHAEARKAKMETDDQDQQHRDKHESVTMATQHLPIGSVTAVDEGSPADRAGIRVGDSIIQFGSLSADNFQGMKNIVNIVQHSVDKPIPVHVLREESTHHLSIVPTHWRQGKGLLGCNIKPSENAKS